MKTLSNNYSLIVNFEARTIDSFNGENGSKVRIQMSDGRHYRGPDKCTMVVVVGLVR